jgi:hypothetical protein
VVPLDEATPTVAVRRSEVEPTGLTGEGTISAESLFLLLLSKFGWLVLSPRAKQMVVHAGHAVEEEDPQLVIDAILDVAKAAR